MEVHEDAGSSGRRRYGRLLQGALFALIAGGVFLGIIPRLADLEEVWAIVRGLSTTETVVLVALAAWNIVTYWPMLVAAMPGLTLGQAAVVCQSSTSVAMTLPAGGALGVGVSYAMYTSWGFTPGDVALSTLLTGVVNMSFKFLFPAISLAVLAIYGEGDRELLSTSLVGVGIAVGTFAVAVQMLRHERFAYRVGTLVGRVGSFFRRLVRLAPIDDGGGAALRFRSKLIRVLRRRGPLLAGAEVVSQLSLFFVLLATLRFVGVPDQTASWAKVLAVFAFVRLGTAVPIVPGNLGIVELGYIGGLVLAGAPRDQAVAAVLVFRFLTFFAQIPIGAVTYFIWRRRHAWRRPRAAPGHRHPNHDAGEVHGPPGDHRGGGLGEHRPDRQDQEPAVPST